MRIALCIGCNHYDDSEYLQQLWGAEEDARQMFGVLVDPNLGNYDGPRSLLLLSPTMAEVRSALGRALYSGDSVTDFTLFFAGHGCMAHDALYLAVRDTKLQTIAISGFGFAELAKIVVAARPTQANFLLDACQSGGLGFDLEAILRQSLTGTAQTSGVAALAAAASDEFAAEIGGGGAFTTALLPILRGAQAIQRDKPYLGIPDIGAALRVDVPGHQQTASTWVLNLQGPNRFSRNPHYAAGLTAHPDLFAGPVHLARADVAAIKRITLELHEKIDELELSRLLERITDGIQVDEAVFLLSGLAEGMAEEARNSLDPFAEGRVLGVFVGRLLRLVGNSQSLQHYVAAVLNQAMAADLRALHQLALSLQEHRFALLGSEALAGLFFLPIRLADILGRIGVLLLREGLSPDELGFLRSLTGLLLQTYGNSIVAVSDEQAAPIAIFVSAAARSGWTDEAEEVVSRLCIDIVETSGRVACHFLEGPEVLRYLQQRSVQPPKLDEVFYQRPSDLVSVSLLMAALLGLDEAVDRSFILLDHTPLNVFIPDSPLELGSSGPISGRNFGLNLGHGVWRCIDIRREWTSTIVPLLDHNIAERNCRQAIYLSALTLRDRVPWLVGLEIGDISLGADFIRIVTT